MPVNSPKAPKAPKAPERAPRRPRPPQPPQRRPSKAALPTPQQRAARGKALRTEVPRESHAEFRPPDGRPDPVDLLELQAKTRVPDLVPVRYGRMLVSEFSYYRGAALPMAADLSVTPRTGLIVQACGDAHLSNFGIFASPERRLVFDLNDFDETLPAPWEWDVKRLAASLEVAARVNGFARKERAAIVTAAARRYRQAMAQFAAMGNLDVWYAAVDVERFRRQFRAEMTPRQRKAVAKAAAKARSRDSVQVFSKLACWQDGRLRIVADPPLVVPVTDLRPEEMEHEGFEARLAGMIAGYRRTMPAERRVLLDQFEFTDMARKVVGIGSVGTRCWVVLMAGRDGADTLFLQVKEAEESVLSPFAGASRWDNQGQRVVVGQRLMQAASDIFLGWVRAVGLEGVQRDFYVRQLRDWKFSADIATMLPGGLRAYGQMCAWTLARAHARSGDRVAIASYLGRSDVFDRSIGEFAATYADQNERDYRRLVEAAAAGRVPVAS
jgi:uncharacterized protein (DUF2252 family)